MTVVRTAIHHSWATPTANAVAFYLTTMGPLYPRLLEDLGYGSEVAAVTAANPTRPATVVPAEAAVLLDELLVHGTPEAARQSLARWRTSGSSPILSLPPGRPADEIEFALRALAPEPDGGA